MESFKQNSWQVALKVTIHCGYFLKSWHSQNNNQEMPAKQNGRKTCNFCLIFPSFSSRAVRRHIWEQEKGFQCCRCWGEGHFSVNALNSVAHARLFSYRVALKTVMLHRKNSSKTIHNVSRMNKIISVKEKLSFSFSGLGLDLVMQATDAELRK